ncbi:MAG: HDOD domain-containing protein [Betaproteobacteria bacterium]|nr:HDOD domain-containing protein [Betaproteobacteria bacterium]
MPNESNDPNQAQQAAFRILTDIAAELSKGDVTFPTFANATLKVRNALDDPNMDAERLARVVSSEPLLSTKLVHIANSAAVNPGGKQVGDVRTAVTRVGFETVRTVAAAVAMTQLRAADDLRRHAQRAAAAWHHSVHVAAMSFVIAEKMTRQRPEEALFAGLIHDIGYFYLLSKSGDYPELESVPAALDDVLRDWHPPIGQAVLHAFKLSDATLMAVVEHENGHYNSPPRTISDVVTLANMVTARTNPIYLNTGTAIPDPPNEPELLEVLAQAKGEIPPAGAGWAQPGHGGARCRRVPWLRYRRTCGSSPSRRPAPARHTKPVRRPRRRVA